MSPESPKIIKNVISWVRDRRQDRVAHRGDRIIKGGIGISDPDSRRGWASSRISSGIKGVSPVKKEEAAVEKVSGIGGVYPAESEVVAQQTIQEIGGKSPLAEGSADQINPGKSSMSFMKQEVPGLSGPRAPGKVSEIKRDREIHKEGHMNDMHYVVRDDNESNLVRRLHPDCNVMIPADYKTAVDEIRACPLNCPYKTLEFTELDQRTLQSRTK